MSTTTSPIIINLETFFDSPVGQQKEHTITIPEEFRQKVATHKSMQSSCGCTTPKLGAKDGSTVLVGYNGSFKGGKDATAVQNVDIFFDDGIADTVRNNKGNMVTNMRKGHISIKVNFRAIPKKEA